MVQLTLLSLIFLVFFGFSVTSVAEGLSDAGGVVIDDACEDGDEECEFWKCYETGKCTGDPPKKSKTKKAVAVPLNPPATSAAEVEKADKTKKAVTASSGKMRKVSKSCYMQLVPAAEGERVGSRPLKVGKRIWTEPTGSPWYKVFRRSGEAYVAADCFL